MRNGASPQEATSESEKAKGRFSSIKSLLRNRSFLVFFVGDITVRLAFEIIDYPLIIYLLSLGFGITAIGQLTSAGLISALISQIPTGILTDRIGRKNSVMLGLCVYAVFPIFYPLSNTYLAFLAIAVISGVANAILVPASLTFVGEIVPTQSRATATTLVYFVGGFLTFGPFIGLALYLVNRALPFVICSLLTIVTICIFRRYIKRPKNHQTATYEERLRIGTRSLTKTLTKTFTRSLVGISVANLAFSFGAGTLFLLGFLYLLDVLGQELLLTGLALIIPLIVSLALSLYIAQWMDRTRKRKTFLILGLLGFGVAAFAFSLVTSAFGAILAWTFLSLMGIIVGASASTLVMNTSEEATKGTAMAVYALFGTAGTIISLQLVGHLQNIYASFQTPFLLVSLSCLWAAIISWVTIKEKPKV